MSNQCSILWLYHNLFSQSSFDKYWGLDIPFIYLFIPSCICSFASLPLMATEVVSIYLFVYLYIYVFIHAWPPLQAMLRWIPCTLCLCTLVFRVLDTANHFLFWHLLHLQLLSCFSSALVNHSFPWAHNACSPLLASVPSLLLKWPLPTHSSCPSLV